MVESAEWIQRKGGEDLKYHMKTVSIKFYQFHPKRPILIFNFGLVGFAMLTCFADYPRGGGCACLLPESELDPSASSESFL